MLNRAKNPINNIMKNIKKYDKINYLDLVNLPILKPDSKKIAVPKPFLKELDKIGEQAISYMENVGEYKQFYESLPTKNKPPFINLTIGGVNRKTPPRNLFDDCSRGYITHLDKSHKIYVSKIFKKLGCDIEPDKVGIAPMRSKVALQHIFGLFKPGIVVAHKPNYKSTIDAAVINYDHTAVEVDVRDRYLALFKEVRNQALIDKNKDKPIILLLVCPHNPTAISMNDKEETELHRLINDIPNLCIIHDIAYQGYHKFDRDAGKIYRDMGMPHKNQIFISIMSTSKSIYASGQPAFWFSDKDTFPFLVDYYQRMATGPTSTFVNDLPYYYQTLDDDYMRSVENNLQLPLIKFIENNKKRWGIDFWIKPDGPPFITLDINKKLHELEINENQFRELTLKIGCPMLISGGCLRIALTGFEKKEHKPMLKEIQNRLDFLFSLQKEDKLISAILV
jgi:aspartate/methionine/tyrosine aminotransferase